MSTTAAQGRVSSGYVDRLRRGAFEPLATARVKLVPPPRSYRVAMMLQATALVLITLGLVALVVFLLWLFFWHAVSAVTSLSAGPYFLFHVPMALIGALLLVLLAKPLFTRNRSERFLLLRLERQQEPRFFEFVDKICAAVNAPPPERIEVDCTANASARFDGFFGIVTQRLVLHIGLPLVAGLNVRQLGGVIAHEFGHFKQHGGMTACNLIRMLNGFFARIVFERDRLDQWLASLKNHPNGLANLAYWLAFLFIEPARGVLWLMLLTGEFLTCQLSRRMEFDADICEAQIAGVEDFEFTNRQVALLSFGAQLMANQLDESFRRRRLPDNLPVLIAHNAKVLARDHVDLVQAIEDAKTRLFDTHPSHAQRVANVKAACADGVITCDLPASTLLRDFVGTCRLATIKHHRYVIGKEYETIKSIATDAYINELQGDENDMRALQRFMRGCAYEVRPIFPADEAPTEESSSALAEALLAARTDQLAAADGLERIYYRYSEARIAVAATQAWRKLLAIFRADASARKFAKLFKDERAAHETLSTFDHASAGFEKAAAQRLRLALCLAECPDMAGVIGNNGSQQARHWSDLCAALQPWAQHMITLREQCLQLQVYMSAYNQHAPHPDHVSVVLALCESMCTALDKVKSGLESVPYPFDHALGDISVARAISIEPSPRNDPGAVHAAALEASERFMSLLFRVLGRIAQMAETLETHLGLERLPDPPRLDRSDEATREKLAHRKAERTYWFTYSLRAAAGLFLIFGLIWLSFSPPEFPRSSNGIAYQPAGFRMNAQQFTAYSPPTPSSSLWTTSSAAGLPRGPSFPPPGVRFDRASGQMVQDDGRGNTRVLGGSVFPQPGSPVLPQTYTPPQPPNYQPRPYSPPTYQPATPRQPGYTPGFNNNRPGGMPQPGGPSPGPPR